MPTYDPPRETGLSGDAYLSEVLEEHVDDLSDAHAPGVYALRLSKPVPGDRETLARAWLEHFDVTPPYLGDVADACEIYYVGAAKNMHARITEHLESPNRSSALCRVLTVHDVFALWPMDSAGEAFTRETGLALDLRRELDGAYVHCR